MKQLSIFTACLLVTLTTNLAAMAQSIGIGTTTPAASAMLHINSTNKGLLIPRLTSAQRNAIVSPAAGLQVYDSNTNSFWYYNNSNWIELGAGGGGSSSWVTNNNNISNTNNGNVGIGTSSPFYKLEVNGNGAFFGSTVNYGFNGQQYVFGGGAVRLTSAASGTVNHSILIDGNQVQSFYTDQALIDEFSNPLLLNALGGNVGIGTSNPLPNSKLTLQTDGDYATAITIRNPSGSASFETYVGGPVNGNTISLGTQGNMPIAIFTNGANRLFINAAGNVGIGTDNPTYKLSVRGNIRSNEVVVETGWADYVFADDYKLRSLEEVESFIQQHKHLPNIPSAAEIEKDGLPVGDTQKRMMEKIEELTLYIIQLKKEMAEIKSSIN
jgi:hypothetical protein